jgi:hypothetical protein
VIQSFLFGRARTLKRGWLMNKNHNNQDCWLFGTVLSDVHFWIPLAVLLGGLVLLKWISR